MKIRFLPILLICLALAGCSTLGIPGTGNTVIVVTATSAPGQAAAPAATQASAATQAPAAMQAGETEQPANETAEPTKPGGTELMEATKPAETEQSTAEQSNSEQSTPEQATTEQTEPTKPAENEAGANAAGSGMGSTLSLDQLLDFQVTDSTGAPVGKVKDAVLDAKGGPNGSGQVTYLIVDSSAREDWYVPVPISSLRMQPAQMTAALPVTAAQFANAPGFNKDAWPASFSAHQNDIQAFWSSPGQAAANPAALGPFLAKDQPGSYLTADDLTSTKLLTPQGVKLGKIKDVALNTQDQFSYVVIELDDQVANNNLWVPLPWRMFNLTPGQENVTVNITPDMLRAAPSFPKGALPDIYGQQWMGQISKYWP